MLPSNLQTIKEDDFKNLVDNQVSESRTLEYKLELPKGTDEDKKEFLADISSFANTVGGDIVYGIEAINGIANGVPGIAIADLDQEILRIESIISSGLQPRIIHTIHAVKLASGSYVIIIRISQSLLAPHRVIFKGQDKFFGRNSAGKYSLDVEQLRTAFLQSDAIEQKIKDLHATRVLDIEAGRTPFIVSGKRKIIIHMIPIESFASKVSLSQKQIEDLSQNLELTRPMYSGSGWNPYRVNLDGWVSNSGVSDEGKSAYTYLQIFRKGYLEAVESMILSGGANFPNYLFEDEIIKFCSKGLSILKKLGLTTPVYIFVTFLGVKGMGMGRDQMRFYANAPLTVEKEILDLPDIAVQSFDEDMTQSMRPSLEVVWNACGIATSENYDKEGNWKTYRGH